MGEWKEMKFSELVEINPPISLSRAKEHFYIEMRDMDPARRYVYPQRKRPLQGGSRFEEGDTLFARISPCTEKGNINQVTGLNGEPGYGSTEFLVFRAKPSISQQDFVLYFSKWNEIKDYAANNLQGTSGRQRVAKEAFDELEVIVPEPDEQRAIASVLSSLDAKIDLLHRQNKTLEGMAETLFRQWFVEEADEGWEEVVLGRFVDCVNGVSYKSSELNPSKTALVTLKNFARDGGFRLDGFKEFDGAYKPQHEVFAGDLVVAHTDITQDASLIGNPVLVVPRAKYDKMVISMDLVKVVPKEAWCSKVFLYHLMRNSAFKEHAVGYSNGSTVLHLSKKAVPEFEFLLPPQEKVERFTALAEGLHRKKNLNIVTVDNLTALRDTLLPKLMSGEVRVEETAN
jgi:type I restriction enzyme S subunit